VRTHGEIASAPWATRHSGPEGMIAMTPPPPLIEARHDRMSPTRLPAELDPLQRPGGMTSVAGGQLGASTGPGMSS